MLQRRCGQTPAHGAQLWPAQCRPPRASAHSGRAVLRSSAGEGFVGVWWWGPTSLGLCQPSGDLREEDLRGGGNLREPGRGEDQRLQPERGRGCPDLQLRLLRLVLTCSQLADRSQGAADGLGFWPGQRRALFSPLSESAPCSTLGRHLGPLLCLRTFFFFLCEGGKEPPPFEGT